MPELPEVETTKNGLISKIIERKVVEVNIYFPKLRWDIPTIIPHKITNQTVQNIIRRGKYLIFKFSTGDLIIHLGMSGKMEITHEKTLKKHDHFELIFNSNGDDICMRLNDPRRFGCVLWTDNYQEHTLIKNLGVEPLDNQFDKQYLHKKAQTKKLNIKAFIMDSKIVVGVGNIYACESLFEAGIHPQTPANKVSQKDYQNLTKIIIKTLKNAIKQGGTTLQDFKGVGGELGYFKQVLQVYGREGENCNNCGGKISRIIQNQRSTFYCEHCQKQQNL
jgi:formamidopyrimidine-DNA glycosylase